MRILIVTPATRGSRTGNRVTANRWAALLGDHGHTVQVASEYTNQRCDVLIAIHALKSAKAIERSRRDHPNRPIILLLSGTDLYRDIHRNTQAQQSLQFADRLVVLQVNGMQELIDAQRAKCQVIYQSTQMPPRAPPVKRWFEFCVVGHLRPVKDPFRAAIAARRLPDISRIRIMQLGQALTARMASRAAAEMERNSRYHWLGNRPAWQARQYIARSQAMVISSKLEGGANVVSDAVVAGVPILASKISGTLGQLGDDYRGYYPFGDTQALAALMQQFETDAAFRRQLKVQVNKRRTLFSKSRERAALKKLIDSL